MLDKIKSLSKQTLIYGTSTIIGRFLNFILVPFYTNVFPPSEYGIVAVIFAYIAFFNIIYSLGYEAGYFRFAGLREIGSDKQNFSHPFFVIAANSFVLSLVIFIFSGSLGGIIRADSRYVVLSAFILFFDALSLVPFAYLRLKNKATVFVTIKLINIFVNVSMNFVLVLVFKMGLIAVFISNLAASFITVLILLPVIFRNISLEYNRELMKELRKFSLPYLPAALASMAIQVVNILIMNYLADTKTVGIYNANYRLGIFMMLIVQMFEYAWRPFFLNNAKEPNAKELFAKVLTIFVGASSLLFIILTFFISDIIKIPLPFNGKHLIGEKYWAGVYIVPVILFAYMFLGIYTNLIAGVYIEKKTNFLPAITGTGAIVNILIGVIFIPQIGIMGGAMAVLMSYFIMTINIYYVNKKYYPVKYETGKIISILIIDVLAVITFFLMWKGIVPSGIIIKCLLTILCLVVITFLSDLWKAKKLLFK